jgi:hypothetical protein
MDSSRPLASSIRISPTGAASVSPIEDVSLNQGDLLTQQVVRNTLTEMNTQVGKRPREKILKPGLCDSCSSTMSAVWRKNKTQCDSCYWKSYKETHREEIATRAQARYQAHKEEMRAYYQAHKEEMKAYYQARKEEIAVKHQAYREAHKEERAAKDQAYRAAHKEEIAIRDQARYQANKKEIAVKRKAYREAHREEIATRARARYQAHKEEIAAKRKAYREARKEEIAAKREAYREVCEEESQAIEILTQLSSSQNIDEDHT